MRWAACRYRPQSLLWNTRVFIFQTTCSDIILIPSTSSNIQQQYPKSLSLFVVVSTPHQLIWWEDAESSTCNSSPWATSQSPNPTGWEQTHKVYSSHFTDKEKGGWWFAQGHKELQRESPEQRTALPAPGLFRHLSCALWAAGASEFTRGISILQTTINCLPSRHWYY